MTQIKGENLRCACGEGDYRKWTRALKQLS